MVLSHCAAMPTVGDDDEGLAVFVLEAEHFVEDMWARSRSSAPVGSTARIKYPGFNMHRARATRCCSPPERVSTCLPRHGRVQPGEHGLGLALPDLFAVTGEAHAEGDVVKGAHVAVGGCGCGQAISWKTFRRDWRELASAGVDEGAEDATLVAIGAVRELRMPLDGPDERLAGIQTASTMLSGAVAIGSSPWPSVRIA